jgi:hypothetical protein
MLCIDVCRRVLCGAVQVKPIPNWPFPVPGQIKKPPTQNDRFAVENRQAEEDKRHALKELGDALF